MAGEFDFDFENLEPAEVPFRYQGKAYALREATAGDAAAYKNAIARGTKWVDGKIAGTDGMADADLLLLSRCVFERPDRPLPNGAQERRVNEALVRSWPARVVTPLLEKLQTMSGLAPQADPAKPGAAAESANGEAPEKNLLGATTDTSA